MVTRIDEEPRENQFGNSERTFYIGNASMALPIVLRGELATTFKPTPGTNTCGPISPT